MTVWTLKRRLTNEQNVEDYTDTEQVTSTSITSVRILQGSDLRSHIPRSTAASKDELRRINFFYQSKICYYALIASSFFEQNVLRFQVPMHVSFLMESFYSHQDTLHNFPSFAWLYLVSKVDFIKELSSSQ